MLFWSFLAGTKKARVSDDPPTQTKQQIHTLHVHHVMQRSTEFPYFYLFINFDGDDDDDDDNENDDDDDDDDNDNDDDARR